LTPEVLEKNEFQGTKKEDFQKNGKTVPPGIHPIYKCAKFQHD